MKIWKSFGSEHSANLVMVGKFKNVDEVEKVIEIIDKLTEQVRNDEKEGLLNIGNYSNKYTNGMLKLLSELNVGSLGPIEIEQFAYDFSIEKEKDSLIFTSEEYDVSAFMKLMVDKGARVEIYSGHFHPESEHGR